VGGAARASRGGPTTSAVRLTSRGRSLPGHRQPEHRRIDLSYSFTSQPDDLDQQEAPNQQGRESDKPKNRSPHD
jgi:hypothetical protein